MQTQTIQPQPAPVAQEPVQTVNGRIVYNRKYGDIPKGSYTGGSTYTVKRGDTLFYIARVTGNDFRDGATQQHPGPYALNVGRYCRSVRLRPADHRRKRRFSGQRKSERRCDDQHNFCTKSTAVVLHNRLLRILNLQVNSATKMLPNKPATTTTTVVAPVTAPTTVSTTQPTASVRQPVRRSQHGAGRLMARLSRTLAARKAAIKVSILQAVRTGYCRDRRWARRLCR